MLVTPVVEVGDWVVSAVLAVAPRLAAIDSCSAAIPAQPVTPAEASVV